MRTCLVIVFSLLFFISTASRAQPTGLTMVKAQTSVKQYAIGGPGNIKCLVQWSLIKNGKNMRIRFYAQNDQLDAPMLLDYKGGEIPLKKNVHASENSYFVVFQPNIKDIFFKDKSPVGYHWKWGGNGNGPVSPLYDLKGKKAKTIKYWFTIMVDGASFTTDYFFFYLK
ncbi:MAG: hypothetical protein ACTHKV_04435 [Flavipsychrobacter sp.]